MNKRANFYLFSSIILVMALTQGVAQAQLARVDRAFLKEASGATLFQQEASRLATIHAGKQNVRVYANGVLKRHAAAELGPLARARGVTAPHMAAAHRNTLNELVRAKGSGFDNLYIQKVALGAQRDEAAMLERAGPGLQDPAIKQWVQAMLPPLREQIAAATHLGARAAALPETKLLKKAVGTSPSPRHERQDRPTAAAASS